MKIIDSVILKLLKKAIKDKNIQKINSIIDSDNFNENLLTDDLILEIINTGYIPNEKTPKIITSNKKYLEVYFSLRKDSFDLIDVFDETALTSEIMDDAINMGYRLSEKSRSFVTSNVEYVNQITNNIMKKVYWNFDITPYNIGVLSEHLKYCDINIISNVLIHLIDLLDSKEGIMNLFNLIDEKYLTKDVIIHAIHKGLFPKDGIFEKIFQNVEYVREYLKQEEILPVNVLYCCDITQLTESEIDSIFLKGSNSNFFEQEFPNNIIKNCSEKNFEHINWNKYISWIRPEYLDHSISSYNGESIVKYFVNKNIDIKKEVENRQEFVLNLIRTSEKDEVISLILYLCREDLLTEIFEDNPELLENKNFIFNFLSPEKILNNEKFLKLIINNSTNTKKIMAAINSFNLSFLSDEIVNLAIDKGYYITSDSPQIIKNNIQYARKIMKKSQNSNEIKITLDNLDQSCLIDEVINLAIDKGYYITSDSPQIIKNNIQYVRKILSNIKEKSKLEELFLYCDFSLIDKDFMKLMIEQGCDFNVLNWDLLLKERSDNVTHGLQNFIDNRNTRIRKCQLLLEENYELEKDLIKYMIKYNKENLEWLFSRTLFVNMFEKYVRKLNFDQMIAFLKETDFSINAKMFQTVKNVTCGEIEKIATQKLSNLDEKHKEFLRPIVENVGNNFAVYYEIDNLFSKDLFFYYNQTELFKIYKYLFLIDKRIDFNEIITSGDIGKFKKIYELLYGNFDVNKLYKFYGEYLRHKDFIRIIDINELSKEKIALLKKIFLLNYTDVQFDDINLENCAQMIYHRNCQNMNDMNNLKDTICLLLFNNKFRKMEHLDKYFLSYNKAIQLSCSIKNDDAKYILKKYALFLNFFEDKILNNDNYDDLKSMAINLNELFLQEYEIFDNVYELFSFMKKSVLTIYGIELNEKLEKTQNDGKKKAVFKEQAFVSNDEKYELNGTKVDYIEYYNDVYFLQHRMNAFGSGAKITDWKNPRLIGKAYICLSLVSNDKLGINNIGSDIDSVTLLFNSFTPENLITFARHDLYTRAEDNATYVTQNVASELDTAENILKNTPDNMHNEYTILRENADGSLMYPCGVKVLGEYPTQEEINAAAYLGVPLIKMNRTLEITHIDKEESISTELESFHQKIEIENLIKFFGSIEENSNRNLKK